MEVYEGRLYQCYGQFHDQELAYTLTKRIDLPKQECFVGIPSSDGKHKIMEAREHCQRGLQPHLYGMDMERVRDVKCDKEMTEDNQTYNNEVNTDDEMFFKLLHPKIKLKRILQAKNNVQKEKENYRSNSSRTPKFLYSNSSVPCLTLSVISLSVLFLFFV